MDQLKKCSQREQILLLCFFIFPFVLVFSEPDHVMNSARVRISEGISVSVLSIDVYSSGFVYLFVVFIYVLVLLAYFGVK